MKCLAPITLVFVLAGCASVVTPLDEDYAIGDTSKSVAAIRSDYCSEVTPTARLGIKALALKIGGTVPKDFCLQPSFGW